MDGRVSYDRREEAIESKARWFKSLSVEQRMNVFVAVTNLILENDPDIANRKSVPASARVRVISLDDIPRTNED